LPLADLIAFLVFVGGMLGRAQPPGLSDSA
jgi:hypothetical protein